MFWAAIAGAAVGGISTLMSGNKQAESLEEQKRNAWQKYLINKDFADFQFQLNKGEALGGLAIQEGRLRQDIGTATENFNTGLLGQAYGIQDAQINLAGQLGAYDAAQGASGTRGNEASGLMKAYAQTSLDRNVDLQYRQNDEAIQGLVTGANRGFNDITREKDSWGEGGYRTMLYNAEDERNRKLALLGQSEYDSAISSAKPGVFDYLTGGLMGANQGMNLYSGIQNASQYVGQPTSKPAYLENMGPYGGGYTTSNSFNSLGGINAQAYNPYQGTTLPTWK